MESEGKGRQRITTVSNSLNAIINDGTTNVNIYFVFLHLFMTPCYQ